MPGLGSCARLVRAERVADDHAAVVTDESTEGRGALVVADPMHDDARRGQAPHLPRLASRRSRAAASPSDRGRSPAAASTCFIERGVDDARAAARATYARSHSVCDVTTRPCRSRIRHLALERDVIEPLVEDDLDRERERVAAAWQRALGTERGLDAAAAATDVLLLLHLDELGS